MALSFWTAIWAWNTCFAVTIGVSAITRQQKSLDELRGLVYSLTPRIRDDSRSPWLLRPAVLGAVMLVVCIALNIIFW
jgi:SSS family solute:Na+ symporter